MADPALPDIRRRYDPAMVVACVHYAAAQLRRCVHEVRTRCRVAYAEGRVSRTVLGRAGHRQARRAADAVPRGRLPTCPGRRWMSAEPAQRAV